MGIQALLLTDPVFFPLNHSVYSYNPIHTQMYTYKLRVRLKIMHSCSKVEKHRIESEIGFIIGIFTAWTLWKSVFEAWSFCGSKFNKMAYTSQVFPFILRTICIPKRKCNQIIGYQPKLYLDFYVWLGESMLIRIIFV